MRYVFYLLLVSLFLFPISPISLALAQNPQKPKTSLNPNISLIGSFAGAWFRNDPIGDQAENPSRTGVNLQGLELSLQSVVDPHVRGDLFLLFREAGVEFEEGTLTTLSLPWNLQVRVGKLLARLGRENAKHLEQLSFVDTPFTNRWFLGVEGFKELGAEVSALLPLPWFSEASAEFLQGENKGNFDGKRRGDFATLGRWTNSFDLSQDLTAQCGLSGVAGFNDTAPGNMTQIYATDLYLRWRPSARIGLKWQTEYLLRRKRTADATPIEGGLHSQFLYQFARRWEVGLRLDQIGIPAEGLRRRALSPDLTFLASEFFRVRGQYNRVETSGAPTGHEAFLQLQFNMGPHGAHAF